MNTQAFLKNLLLHIVFLAATILISGEIMAQKTSNYMRIAKIVVDSAQLETYKIALKEQMNAALTKERGVLSYAAVYDKEHPTHITILETYASLDAYKKHIQAAHFLKYKTTVAGMVKALELTEVEPLAIEKNKMK